MDNLFANVPAHLHTELVEVLTENKSVRIERIVSTGHSSPDDYWCDQDKHEWVVVLQGDATLMFEDGETIHMKLGDHIVIPARQKHRVDWTSAEQPTVWLAVFY